MLLLDATRRQTLRSRFLPDRPGPLVGLHVIGTGNGACFVDRWPEPRAIVMSSGGNHSIAGDPDTLRPEDLPGSLAGLIDAPKAFEPVLREAFPDLKIWGRVILELTRAPELHTPRGAAVRRLEGADARHLQGLSPDSEWISATWGGASSLAASAAAWGAFIDGTLVSVAVPFFVGDRYEDLGVVTEAPYRGRGLSVACAARLAEEILGRGRAASWSTSPDNLPSLRVAEKVGFEKVRDDRLFVVGQPIPGVARRGAA